MGNQKFQHKPVTIFMYFLKQKYREMGPVELSYAGQVRLYSLTQKSSQLPTQVISKKAIFQSRQILKKSLQVYLRLTHIQHPNLLLPLHIQQNQQNSFFNKEVEVQIYSEYFPHTLAHEINKRKFDSNYFPEDMLILICARLVSALQYLHKSCFFNGFISSKHIIISQNSQLKIVDRFLLMANYETNMPYFSPEILQNLQYERSQFSYQPFKADIYSLGLVFFELASLNVVSKIFDSVHFRINTKQMQKELADIQLRYGSNFKKLLDSMLSPFDQKRLKAAEIRQALKRGRPKEGIFQEQTRSIRASQLNIKQRIKQLTRPSVGTKTCCD